MTTATERFEELCVAAERRAMRVLLEVEGRGEKTRLAKVKVDDPRADDLVVSVRVGPKGLEYAAAAALRLLLRQEAK